MSSSPTIERVTALVTPILDDLGLDLYDVEFGGGQLTITIDTRLPGAPADPEAPARLAERIAADERESARAAAAADDEDDDELDGDGPTDDEPSKRGPGITLDVLALATRLISRELDHADPIPGRYTLEVSSPGLERTLRTPAHFRRSIGSEVAVRLRDVTSDARRVHGVLSAVGDHTFSVITSAGTVREVGYEQVDRARTVFTWGPAAKPAPAKGKSKGGSKSRQQSITTPTAATDDTTEAPAP